MSLMDENLASYNLTTTTRSVSFSLNEHLGSLSSFGYLSAQSTYPQPSRLGSALGAIVAFLFIIFGIFGDSLIIIAILSKRELRNNLVNIFIVSLQLNDIFNIGFNQFLVGLSYLFMKWHGPYLICEVFVYTSIICTGSLLWHHALISIHRYLVVVCNFNITYFKATPKFYVLISIIIARLIPTIVCIPALVNRNMTVYSPAALRCLLAPNVSGFQNLLIVLVNMLLPCLIVIFCFAHIFIRVHTVSRNIRKAFLSAKKHNRKSLTSQLANEIINNYSGSKQPAKIENDKADFRETRQTAGVNLEHNHHPYHQNPHSHHQHNLKSHYNHKKESRSELSAKASIGSKLSHPNTLSYTISSVHREIQISKMFAIIFIVFLFGYLPYGIIRLIDTKNNLNPDVYVLLTVLFIISISVSPVIYGLMNNQIRIQCTVLLRKMFGCNEHGDEYDQNASVTNLRASRHSGISPNFNHKDSAPNMAKNNNNSSTPPNETDKTSQLVTFTLKENENLIVSGSLPTLADEPREENNHHEHQPDDETVVREKRQLKKQSRRKKKRDHQKEYFSLTSTVSSSLKAPKPSSVNKSLNASVFIRLFGGKFNAASTKHLHDTDANSKHESVEPAAIMVKQSSNGTHVIEIVSSSENKLNAHDYISNSIESLSALNKTSKIPIDPQDDGGVYKGPL